MISKCGEFNKTIIPFALIGYEIGYTTRRYAPRWLFTISYPTRAHGIIVKYPFYRTFLFLFLKVSEEIVWEPLFFRSFIFCGKNYQISFHGLNSTPGFEC